MKLISKISLLVIIFSLSLYPVRVTAANYEVKTDQHLIYIIEEDDAFQSSWKFDHKVELPLDLNLKLSSFSPVQSLINQALKNKQIKRQYLHFKHHGPLPA